MNVLIFYILSFLIGIILFKLLYNRECFNIDIKNSQKKINISKTLSLQEYDCNGNPKPQLCPNNLLYHDGSCYSLLDENDNLSNLFLGEYILVEIIDLNNNNKEYIKFTETGNIEDLNEFIADIKANEYDGGIDLLLFFTNILNIITYLIISCLIKKNCLDTTPLPKILVNKNDDILLLGINLDTNGELIIEPLYKGGGILIFSHIHKFSDSNIVFIIKNSDFNFDNIQYHKSTFKNNSNGYKLYEYDTKKQNIINVPVVTIKFYKKSKSVPTGIEPVT